jgi:hypothetical protein
VNSDRKITHSTNNAHTVGSTQVHKLHPNAEIPEFVKDEDGFGYFYDLSVHARTDNRSDDVTHDTNGFLTGIAIVPPTGFHFELTEHPDLHKYGYQMHPSLTIDHTANPEEEIQISLYKFRDCDDLNTPFPVARMFLRMNMITSLEVVNAKKNTSNNTSNRNSRNVETYNTAKL